MIITIHYDFTDGSEISYVEGLTTSTDFSTCCLDFFNNDIDVEDVIVIKRDGAYISRKDIDKHTLKEIRHAHNIHKMLVANTFNWLK